MLARSIALLGLAFAPLLSSVAPGAEAATPRGTQIAMVSVGMPSEFGSLAQEQHMVADVFFGGRPVGQFEVDAAPGTVRILHPDQLVAALPGVADTRAVGNALAGTLDANARYICNAADAPCERPAPDIAAIVFDQQRFRIDLFINPKLLVVRPTSLDRYLAPAGHGLSLVDTVGGALAGGTEEPAAYSVRNRAVLSEGNARLISEMSVSSGRGADVDTLAAQVDRPDLRYSAGLYYSPGADLVGRRRIVGAGFASQFDTRVDRTVMTGSPLIVFLGQRSRVDLYSEGRLMASHLYEAGNQTLDTSSLPDGSYPIEIRIQEAGGATRTETRFFTKSAAIPPPGHTVLFANIGMLAVDHDHQWVGLSHIPLAIAGVARRAGAHFAWDATMMATNRKGLAELGLSLLTRPMQARIAVLGSSTGDYGILAQAVSATAGPIGYNIDLRHVQSHDGRPLIPLDDYDVDPFSVADLAAQQAQLSGTTFTQMIANLSYRIGRAQIGAAAYLRRDVGRSASYAIGPTMHWPILQRQRLQLTFDGSYAETDHGRSMAFGLRLQIFGKRSSLNASAGAQTKASGRGTAAVAEVGGSIQRDNVLGGQLSASGAVQKADDGTLLQASADERGPAGYGSASLIQRLDGNHSATQYALTMQTSVAASRHAFRIGARDQNDSIIAVRLDGAARNARFQVLVNDTPEGIIRPGGRFTISVTPYRRYTVRIQPIGGDLVAFDTKVRTIDVYPGSVAVLGWQADPVMAMFGRMVQPDGAIIANADITATGAVAATDERGYFQLQAARDAVLTVRRGDGSLCHAALAANATQAAYTALGDVTCRP